jgi:hypothetical protein
MKRAFAVYVLLAGAACAVPTETCTPPANILGTWTYASQQQSLGGVTASGTLVVDHQSCRDFDGSIDAIQQDASGQRTRLSGRITGRVLDAASLQFDAEFGAVPRQHLATLEGGTMNGSWLEVSGSGGASGAFTSQRESGATR